ncbi:MAG: 4Fe-4S ferredoxin [Methylococcaceae bacterium TMED69]|nr:MAG: 4Fe-4S ferredoxin [Methylococcaceae bacterium TMED69]
MSVDFDVIVVGSGPAGVSATFPLIESGVQVLMVDGGKKEDVPLSDDNFLSARTHDNNQWIWMVGEDFHALKMRDAVSPKLRAPSQTYAFADFQSGNQIKSSDFTVVGSLAKGGLSNAWGCGVARLSQAELAEFPFTTSEMDASYEKVSRRIGISGRSNDDMSAYFGLDEYAQPPIPMDGLHKWLANRYEKKRTYLNAQGFKLGRSRLATLNTDFSDRKACNLCSKCLWGCSRGSLYSANHDLPALRKHSNFNELSGFVVDNLHFGHGGWTVTGQTSVDNTQRSYTANKIILALGTLATTRIVSRVLDIKRSLTLLSNPTAACLIWVPRLLGTKRINGFGLGQLSFSLALNNGLSAFGSTFSTTGIPMSEFVRHVPMARRFGVDLLKGIMSSCVVGNLFLPGQLTKAETKLSDSGTLIISGSYSDNVEPFMEEARNKLSKAYRSMGALLLPGSFTVGKPGGDIHYSGTLPMREVPGIGETSSMGEVKGMEGVFVVDGSCLPNLLAKSHTLTIMANADRIGGLIAANLCSGSTA